MSDVMHNFELYQPDSVQGAADLLGEFEDAWVIAGAKDSLGWFKDRVKQPSVVVDIGGIAELSGIEETEDGGLYIGATTTLTDVVENPLVSERYPVLSLSASKVASPQIRNAGTIGGNISQDTRCVYYRSGFPCYRAEGNTCYANTPTAMNRDHALFEVSRCVAVTPSDTAPAMVALDASMVIRRKGEDIEVAASEYFIGPEIDITRMTVLEHGDILLGIRIPGTWANARHYFEKAADRNTWDFALVSITMVAKMAGNAIEDASMVCGGVQCTPRRLTEVEDVIRGEVPGPEVETLVRRVASRGAQPLNFNHFKIPLMESLAARAVRSLT